jgi:hypothetical protein
MPECKEQVGGQAVIEGVMMRNKERLAIAVRCPKRGIVMRQEILTPWSSGQSFLNFRWSGEWWPSLRCFLLAPEPSCILPIRPWKEEEEQLTSYPVGPDGGRPWFWALVFLSCCPRC